MTAPTSTGPSRATFPGLLLLSAATLLFEVALTRVLSVTLWYPFAFMVVSTALFGFGFAGVALSLRREPASASTRLVATAAIAAPLAFALGYALFQRIPVEPFSLATEPRQWALLAAAYLAIALPFFAAGAAIAATLTRHTAAIHRLYLFDLVGAGLGGLMVPVLLPPLGGSGTVLCAGALAGGAAVLLSWEAGTRFRLAAAIAGILVSALVPLAERVAPVRISRDKALVGIPVSRILAQPRVPPRTQWNSLSRIDVVESPEGLIALIDAGTAVTRIAHPERPLGEVGGPTTEESFFLKLFTAPKVLVVGSGGGREVLLALRSGAARVTGVEINPAINALVTGPLAEWTGNLASDPRVHLVTDEGRSFLRRSNERFQVIHLPHTISNAAMASGSLSLAENYLLTLEALDDYLGRLTNDGILLVTRPEAHLPRLAATVRAALERRGVKDVASRVVLWRGQYKGLAFDAGLALRLRPFTAEETAAFEALAPARRIDALWLGDRGMDAYRAVLTAPSPSPALFPFPTLLEPATDDQPFFNRRVPLSQIRWSDLTGVFSQGKGSRAALEDRPVAEAALVVLLLQAVALSLAFIVLPLLVFKRRALGGAGTSRTLAGFAALGLAYIVVEVAFIQRFTLFLGQPVVVFATVLGSLLVASGLGSAFARRFDGPRAAGWACLAAGLTAAAAGALASGVSAWALELSLPVRVALAAVVLAPAGFVMGMPFPLLVRRLEHEQPARIPWAWGVNGFASVVGSIGALVLGMAAGYSVVFVAGVACYLAATALTLRRPLW